MSDTAACPIPDELVDAAIRAGQRRGVDIADVPIIELAAEAGISRSTLIRRLGGSRRALDEAVRAAGVDPGGGTDARRRLHAAAGLPVPLADDSG